MANEINKNNMARRLKHESAIHRNYIRLHPQNSREHEFKKAEICWDLLKQGKEFVTEAKFKSGIRADIFVLDDGELIEIESSDYKLEERKKNYPDDLKLTIIKLSD